MLRRLARNKKISRFPRNTLARKRRALPLTAKISSLIESPMRAAFLVLLAFSLVLPTYAIPADQGGVVQGKYIASGKAVVAGVTIRYLKSKAHVTGHGRIRGKITKTVSSNGVVLQTRVVKIDGNIKSIRRKHGSFTAPTVIRLGDGTVIKGNFHGLVDSSQKLSRYFRGKLASSNNSQFLLRAR